MSLDVFLCVSRCVAIYHVTCVHGATYVVSLLVSFPAFVGSASVSFSSSSLLHNTRGRSVGMEITTHILPNAPPYRGEGTLIGRFWLRHFCCATSKLYFLQDFEQIRQLLHTFSGLDFHVLWASRWDPVTESHAKHEYRCQFGPDLI